MNPLTEDEMTALTEEDIYEENTETNNEMENLQNSFLEVVHDENIQPKMTCLMMDSSFSMVTMQGEDSGIEWETTPSRSATPWTSEPGNLSTDISAGTGGSSPGASYAAGKIIFVMDEELISRQKRTKEAKGPEDKQKGTQQLLGSADNVSGRPELVSFSQPNVQTNICEQEETLSESFVDKEQSLFRLVSEGSEILNIIVPSKMATVDEEESKDIQDNLSYLEASTVVKANEDILDQTNELPNELLQTPLSSELDIAITTTGAPSMDPPGAPVPNLSSKEPPNVDYFEAFALAEAQAPGSPAVTDQDECKEAFTLDNEKTCEAKVDSNNTTSCKDDENSDNIGFVELPSELLDDVFYGSYNYSKTTDKVEDTKRVLSRPSFKQTGTTLFGSQEDILTPIYLPEGPPKIIDPILLEEPKAMAFLYTDLYEEATGSRKKEEDTESLSSEKSFHSRHSDREARGYLEKYVLIDETPTLDVPQNEDVEHPKDAPRTISQNVYEFDIMFSKPEKNQIPDSEEEVTDFFRSCADSSPCSFERLSRLEEEGDQTPTNDKEKTMKKHAIVREKSECTDNSLEFSVDDHDWESAFEDVVPVCEKEETETEQKSIQHMEVQLPIAALRHKTSALQRVCLDLTPLTPVDLQEEMVVGSKEDLEEEKETASPAETANEGDEEETSESLSEVTSSQETPDETTEGEIMTETENTVSVLSSQIENVDFEEDNKTLEANESEKVITELVETTNEESTTPPNDAAKQTAKCIIL